MLASALMAGGLAWQTWDIHFWPTDSFTPYIPTAARLFDIPWLSQMHDLPEKGLNRLNMHGKEALILGIALMQKLLADPRHLFPNILLLISAVAASSVLMFTIFRRLFDTVTAVIIFVLFSGCFWPYLYILQGAHPPLVLLNFLMSFFLLLKSSSLSGKKSTLLSMAAGLFFGLMMFSSPTALIYWPYFLLIPLLQQQRRIPKPASLLAWGFGLTLPILLFTLPDPAHNMQQFLTFVLTCQGGNHFGHYRPYLLTLFPLPETFRGAGWPWVLRYAMLVTPVIFPAYLFSIGYIIQRGFYNRILLGVIVISLSTPLAVETAQVAQFGRNYFSWLFGMLILIGLSLHQWRTTKTSPSVRHKVYAGIVSVIILHVVLNATAFMTDIFPTRMAVTLAARWLRRHNIQKVLVYQNHPNNLFTADVLDNPPERLTIYNIPRISVPRDGYILIPPISGKTIWNDCACDDFRDDPWLNALAASGSLDRLAALKLPTMGWSRYWNQEEEICTYRDLILGQITAEDRGRSYLYLVDAARLQDYWQTARPQTNADKF